MGIIPHYDKNYPVPRKTSGQVHFNREPGHTPCLYKTDEDGQISRELLKVATCGDLHLHTENSALSFTALRRLLDAERPDLLILLGDNAVDRTDDRYARKLIRFFEERKQYYGFVLGNHDSETWIREKRKEREKKGELSLEEQKALVKEGREWAFRILADSPYCVVFPEAPELPGAGNCVINLRNRDGIFQSLFFIDSGDYVIGLRRKAYGTEKRSFGYIEKATLQWYERRLRELTAENGGVLPKSMAFFHIPLQEYEDAYRKARFFPSGTRRIFGTNCEKPCYGDLNDGAFDVFLRNGSTKITVCGHDHKNDSVIRYRGMILMYTMGLPFDGAYNRHKKDRIRKFLRKLGKRFNTFSEGISVFLIDGSGEVEIHARYAHEVDAYRGMEQYFRSAYFE